LRTRRAEPSYATATRAPGLSTDATTTGTSAAMGHSPVILLRMVQAHGSAPPVSSAAIRSALLSPILRKSCSDPRSIRLRARDAIDPMILSPALMSAGTADATTARPSSDPASRDRSDDPSKTRSRSHGLPWSIPRLRPQCRKREAERSERGVLPWRNLQSSIDRDRRHFAVEPILLYGECSPSPRHTYVSHERWLADRLLREEPAVIGAVAQNV
jgi:hypothetical protein